MGLTACDIVSKWTWAATLLQSSNVAFQYGVSGPFWYASGATIQVLLFAVLAVEIKRKCPAIHTALEVVHARWGTGPHLVFMAFMLITNIIVTSMLILGGSAVINALSGVDLTAAAFLIPFGVTLYTAQGGLMATFMASWAHVAIIYIALCIFMFIIYTSDPMLGSPKRVWDHLNIMNGIVPIEFNQPMGTMLTMKSHNGLLFGIVRFLAPSALFPPHPLTPPARPVWTDQHHWQLRHRVRGPGLLAGCVRAPARNDGLRPRAHFPLPRPSPPLSGAIAAKPSATYKGYLLGGMCWFAIPFTLATTLGLSARAFDLPMTYAEAGSGLVPPAVASHTMGTGGAFLIVLQLFMAVTASGSAEQIAVASIFSYDIFKRYFKPNATGKDIIMMSRVGVVCYGIISGMLAVTLQQLGLNLGWVYNAMGIFIGSAVVPLSLALTWNKCSGFAAVTGAVLAQFAGLIAWMVQAKLTSKKKGIAAGYPAGGNVTYESLGELNAQLAGNCAALFGSIFVTVPLSLIWPQNYDWKELRKITDGNQVDTAETDDSAKLDAEGADSPEAMDIALNWTYKTGGVLTLVLIILWPVLAIPAGHFTPSYWGWWVALAIMWGLLAAIATILLPLWEARKPILAVFSSLIHGHVPEGHEPSVHQPKAEA